MSNLRGFPCYSCGQMLAGIPPMMSRWGSPKSKEYLGSPEFQAKHEIVKCPSCGEEEWIARGTDQPAKAGYFWCSGCGTELENGTTKCPECW